jgi:hypothetical protein
VHIDNDKISSASYKEGFDTIYKGNLCENADIDTTLIPYNCNTYLSNSAIHVQINIVHYKHIGIANNNSEILWDIA